MHQLLTELANYVGKAWANEWLKKSDGETVGQVLESAGKTVLNPDSTEGKPLVPLAHATFKSDRLDTSVRENDHS